MIDDIEEQRLLARARRGLSPCELDEARVLAKLEQRLAEGSELQSEPRESPTRSPATGSGREHRSEGARGLRPRMAALLTAAAGALLLTALGSIRVARLWRADTHGQRANHGGVTAPKAVEAGGFLPVPDEHLATSGSAAQAGQLPGTEAAQDSPVGPPLSAAPAAKAKRRAPPPCPKRDDCRMLPAARVIAPSPPPPEAVPSLRAELEALKSSERAVREHQPARALEILASFEREAHGSGSMQQERAATQAMARCALERAHGPSLYEAFVRAYPRSAYAVRVRRSCEPGP